MGLGLVGMIRPGDPRELCMYVAAREGVPCLTFSLDNVMLLAHIRAQVSEAKTTISYGRPLCALTPTANEPWGSFVSISTRTCSLMQLDCTLRGRTLNDIALLLSQHHPTLKVTGARLQIVDSNIVCNGRISGLCRWVTTHLGGEGMPHVGRFN